MSTRESLASAASIAGKTNVTPYYRQSLRAGDGFVRLAQRVRDTSGFGFMDHWEVWIALPSEAAAGEKWLETNIDALIAAIAPVMVVTSVQPAQLGMDPNTVNGVIIAGSAPA